MQLKQVLVPLQLDLTVNVNSPVFVFPHVDLSSGANQTHFRIQSTAMGLFHITG